MAILNSLDQVWQNLLAIVVVFFVLFWVYKNMQDTSFKRWISETITRIKEMIKGDE